MARSYPYTLVAIFVQGHEIHVQSGHNPMEVRAAAERVSRNPKVIRRIELRDLTGVLETIWANTWDDVAAR